jgi:hypothetical protein
VIIINACLNKILRRPSLARGALAYVILASLSGGALPVLAAEQVALITEVSGTITPALEAFTEVEAGSAIDLGSDGHIEFLHYPTCQKVVAEGGRLSVTVENFRVNKGQIIDISKAECPQRVQLASNEAGAGIAGVVLRGAADVTLKVSQRPRFLLLGAAAGQFKTLAVLQGGTSLLVLPLDGKPLIWPETKDPLPPAGDYVVELTSADAKIRRLPMQVTNQKSQNVPAIIQIQ